MLGFAHKASQNYQQNALRDVKFPYFQLLKALVSISQSEGLYSGCTSALSVFRGGNWANVAQPYYRLLHIFRQLQLCWLFVNGLPSNHWFGGFRFWGVWRVAFVVFLVDCFLLVVLFCSGFSVCLFVLVVFLSVKQKDFCPGSCRQLLFFCLKGTVVLLLDPQHPQIQWSTWVARTLHCRAGTLLGRSPGRRDRLGPGLDWRTEVQKQRRA